MRTKPKRYALSRQEREEAALARLKLSNRGLPAAAQRMCSGGGPPSGRNEFGEHIEYSCRDQL